MKRRSNYKPPLCLCGCKQPVKMARNGSYNKYLRGHNSKSDQPSNNGNSTRFQVGNKHGKGRPQGSKNAVTIAAQQVLEKNASAISKKAVAMALDGDRQMIKMILERIVPVKKSVPIRLPDMPQVTSVGDLPALTGYVLQAISAGKLSAADGATLSNVVRNHKDALVIGQIEIRLSELENSLNAGQ